MFFHKIKNTPNKYQAGTPITKTWFFHHSFYNLNDKFGSIDKCDVYVNVPSKLKIEDFYHINRLGYILQNVKSGEYKLGDLSISVK